MAVAAANAVLDIHQLLLELGASGSGTSRQTAIAGRAEVLPGCNGCATGDVEVDGLIGGHTIRRE